MSEEIKNCPFCGSPVNPTRAWYGVADYSVCRCSNPDCPGELNYEFMPAEIWNTRPVEDALNKRIAVLEEDIATQEELLNEQDKRIAELETENAALKNVPQSIELWSDEKKQVYKDNESRSAKSGKEEREK